MGIYGLIAAAVFAAMLSFAGWKVWDGFTGQYVNEGFSKGVAKQLALDEPLVAKAKADTAAAIARADKSDADAVQAKAGSDKQNDALKAAKAETDVAVAAARKQSIAYAQEVARKDSRIKTLTDTAAAVPRKGQTCEAILSATDAILRESARQRAAP